MKNLRKQGLFCVLGSVSISVSMMLLAQSAWSMSVQVAEAPANDLALTTSAIQSAQTSIVLNIYELSSPDIADALINRITAGVQVEILEEAQPVGGMSTASKGIVSQLVQAMKSANSSDKFFEMTSKAGGKRRFHYDHAKYVVIDGQDLLIGSENYSPTGNPEPGTVGNRGWEVFVQDSSLAQQFAEMFQSDSDTSHGDVMDMTADGVAYALGLPGFETWRKKPKPRPIHAPVYPNPVGKTTPPDPTGQILNASEIGSFTSPTTSLSGLESIFQTASTSIDIELMTFAPTWGSSASAGQDPLINDIIDAARRGVKVRVLLNDETVFDTGNTPSKPVNRTTIQLLQNAAAGGLPIEALVANVKAMGVDYIHNKGVVIDGDKTLISSINWDENSIMNNREAAVLITSPDVYSHYEALFEQDWNASGGSSSTAVTNTAYSGAINTPNLSPSQCPDAITLDVSIDRLTLQDTEDKSFAALSGLSMNLFMARDKTTAGCLFMTADRLDQKNVFEIREASNGETIYSLDGYTGAGKLYSIRAKTSVDVDAGTHLAASVYDGHERLGGAKMTITSE